ncbi:DoxX family protein [Lederbergia panacisoli]|uniref:DoxX family protein n=1 Tax=Lederbergia panacisoli TaxID=1255251 RepID=UPI00214B1A33|nr:DoxX family membrane protein [Lederbergia panacisoli]MCR2822380.1 DoxX family membrane protein [Lederbergia panacisoli]
MKKLFDERVIGIIWAVLRIWLGVQWLQAGWHKAFGGFDATGFLHGAIAKAGGEAPIVQGWYAAFLENVALPNVKLFNVMIAWGELLVGIGLILGALTIPALIAAGIMNLNFLWAGTIATNPTLLLAAFVLLIAWKGATYYGADRFLIPAVKKAIQNRNQNKLTKTPNVHAGQNA